MPTAVTIPSDEDAQGLTLTERRMLQEIAAVGDWEKAAKNMNMDKRKVRSMFKRAAFKREYDILFPVEEARVTQAELTLISEDAGTIYRQAIDAEIEKKIPVECDECGHKQYVLVKVMDWAVKLRAIETLLKVAHVIKDERSLKVEAKVDVVNVQLTTGEFLALKQLEMGMPVPEHIYRQLEVKSKDSGFDMPPMPQGAGPHILEGDFHEVNQSSEQ